MDSQQCRVLLQLRELNERRNAGNKAVIKPAMGMDDYASYVEMNDRFHKLLVQGCGNGA